VSQRKTFQNLHA